MWPCCVRITYRVNETETNEVGAIVVAIWYDVRLDEEVLEEDGEGDELESCISSHFAGLYSDRVRLCRTSWSEVWVERRTALCHTAGNFEILFVCLDCAVCARVS